MSADVERMPLAHAEELAHDLERELAPYCTRTLIAGSIRRRREFVKDIELLVEPKAVDPGEIWAHDVFDGKLVALQDQELLKPREVNNHGAWGRRYKRAWWKGAPVDLFIVLPPECKKCGKILHTSTGVSQYGPARDSSESVRGVRNDHGRTTAFEPSRATGVQQTMFRVPDLAETSAGTQSPPGPVPDMRQGGPSEGDVQTGKDVLQGMHGRTAAAEQPAAASTLDRVPGQDGVEGDESEREWIRPRLPTPTSERYEQGQHPGASARDGESLGPLPRSSREGSPPRRSETPQLDRQLGDRDGRSPTRLGDLSSLSQELPGSLSLPATCPNCGAVGAWRAQQWGLLAIIRTGPAEFSKRLVTPTRHGGLLPGWLKVKDGAIWRARLDSRDLELVPTPSELDVWIQLGIAEITIGERA